MSSPLIRICAMALLAAMPSATLSSTSVLGRDGAAPVRLAYVISYGNRISRTYFDESLAAIARSVAPAQLLVKGFSPEEFTRAAQASQFDIAIASSGLTTLALGRANGRAQLFLVTDAATNPNEGNGTAIIAQSSRTDIRSLKDLRGKSLAIVSDKAFAGYQIPMGELQKNGLDPNHCFVRINKVGMPFSNVIEAVRSGRCDVGFVVTGMLEEMIAAGSVREEEFRIIHEQKHPGFSMRHSTALYPSWCVSLQPTLPASQAKTIVQSLLALTANKSGAQWTVASDTHKLNELFDLMQLQFTHQHTLEWLLRNYAGWILTTFALVALLVLNSLVLLELVRRRSQELEKAYAEKLQAERRSRASERRIASMQKIGSLGLLSSMVAHELKQPLVVISNYAQGLTMRAARGPLAGPTLDTALEEIHTAASRASRIIENVRTYARSSKPQRTACDLCDIAGRILSLFSEKAEAGHLRLVLQGSVPIHANPLEMEIVLMNLVKNAFEAVAANTSPRVTVRVGIEQEKAFACVQDNGPVISDADFSRLKSINGSSKEDGLGLGLAIVRQILLNHGGTLRIERLSAGGLCMTVHLPLAGQSLKAGDVQHTS